MHARTVHLFECATAREGWNKQRMIWVKQPYQCLNSLARSLAHAHSLRFNPLSISPTHCILTCS